MRFPASFTVSTPSDREIRITRDFDASPAMVFDAFTRPELVRRWLLGPPGWTMPKCDIDLCVGGAYRYVWRADADGTQMAVGGTFGEIVIHKRLVATERFDDAWYSGEALLTTTFSAVDGHTSVTITILYESQEARDAARRSGMERGMSAGYDRLERLLESSVGETP